MGALRLSKRADAIGFFWQDVPVEKVVVEKVKRTPPERTWESPNYLPGLEEAVTFRPLLFTDYELGIAASNKEPLLFDIEVYPNYALFAFQSVVSKKCVYFQCDSDGKREVNIPKLQYVLQNFCIINFNGRKYDFIIAAMAVAGCSTEQMWQATEMIIMYEQRDRDVYAKFRVAKLPALNQIDLIDLTALAPGLKVCAGRLHTKRMQDLPFVPGTVLSPEQISILFMYCFNDLDNTELLYQSLQEQITVREDTGRKYGLDLRSHSDQQMAEAIIGSEVKKTLLGKRRLTKTVLPVGTSYKFQPALFLKFSTPLMQHILHNVCTEDWGVDEFEGNIVVPKSVGLVTIADNSYQMGIGGLHSKEKSAAHLANEDYFIADTDATSYYPRLIINAGMAPPNMGEGFRTVYQQIVDQRVAAKRAGDTTLAECLKIVVNGTFGKLGSKYSIMYAPNLMMQVTVTGQLSMLMLIERFELNGIQVLSANTDGIVTRCLRSKEDLFYSIVRQWEKDTGFGTEEVRYKAVYSRDVNNYIAVYETPQKGKKVKGKGVYAPTSSKKNAVNEICIEAAINFITDNIPVMTTLQASRDISSFTSMRRVTGGAVKDDVYLGKIIRWYYSTESQGEIIYAKTGNKVPKSDGAKPCMNLPEEFPTDIDYDWYAKETQEILEGIGCVVAAEANEN